MNETGRRAQHKAATREALHQAALRMFEERGYDATTVKDIAAAAAVTERTFFRYFPSKEDLVLGELSDLVRPLTEEIRRRPADEPPLRAVLNALLTVAGARGSGFAVLFSGPPARFVSAPTRPAHPVLFDFEKGIAEALHARMDGVGPASLRASVLARAAVAAMRSALIAHADLEGERPVPGAIAGLLGEAFDALESPG